MKTGAKIAIAVVATVAAGAAAIFGLVKAGKLDKPEFHFGKKTDKE